MILTHRLVLLATLQQLASEIRRNLRDLNFDVADPEESEEQLAQKAVLAKVEILVAEQQRAIGEKIRGETT